MTGESILMHTHMMDYVSPILIRYPGAMEDGGYVPTEEDLVIIPIGVAPMT